MIDETEAQLAALRANADQGEKYYSDQIDIIIQTYRDFSRSLSRIDAISLLAWILLEEEKSQTRLILCTELAVAIDRLSRTE